VKPTVKLEGVTKVIGKKTIIDNISFEIQPGEVFGFLGPNGAGKTTTIRMLVGLIKPTSGKITVCDFDVRKQFVQAMERIGSIVENPELYKYLTGRENLQVFARMLPNVDDARIQEVIDLVDLTARVDDQVRTYSLGMRQRLGIAQALLGRPSVLILDEPTRGVDVGAKKEIYLIMNELAAAGVAIIMVSSDLPEILGMSDRVYVMREGKMSGMLTRQEATQESIMTLATGGQ